jgi:hypothetical protein
MARLFMRDNAQNPENCHNFKTIRFSKKLFTVRHPHDGDSTLMPLPALSAEGRNYAVGALVMTENFILSNVHADLHNCLFKTRIAQLFRKINVWQVEQVLQQLKVGKVKVSLIFLRACEYCCGN